MTDSRVSRLPGPRVRGRRACVDGGRGRGAAGRAACRARRREARVAADAARGDQFHRDQPVRRGRRVHEGDGRRLAADSPDDLRLHVRRPPAAARRDRRARRDAGAGAGHREDAHLHPGQHSRRRGRGQGSRPLAAAIDCERRTRSLAPARRPADQSDLQRRRQRARERAQPRQPVRSDRRHGPARQRREPRSQPRQHEARNIRGAVAGPAAHAVRPAHRDRPAHDERQRSRLLPDLRNIGEPEHVAGHHEPRARRSAAVGDEGGQSEARLELLLLRRAHPARASGCGRATSTCTSPATRRPTSASATGSASCRRPTRTRASRIASRPTTGSSRKSSTTR